MSCYKNNCYLPNPTREWSRVQNSCSLETTNSNNSLVQVPYSKKVVPGSQIGYYLAMLNKGNVLQYRANSSNSTQAQKYSKIAQGKWVNRNTTWAVQSSSGYTNPNTTSLQRSGNFINIAIDPITGQVLGPTTLPVTCPTPLIPFNPYIPINGGGGSINEPPTPPPVQPTIDSNIFPPIIPVTPIAPIVIQDGGTLVCSIQENICTGQIKSTLAQQLCNLTTDSDVPGPIQPLCWNDGNPTWYPRQRYVMTNSGNKWPYDSGTNNVNSEGIGLSPPLLQSAIPLYPPNIVSISSVRDVVTLSWIPNNECLPTANYNIFENNLLIKRLNGNILTTQIVVNNCNTYEYYIISTNGSVSSITSNRVSISIAYVEPPINLNYTIVDYSTYEIQLTWDNPYEPCVIVSYYKIYQVGGSTVYISTTKSININLSNKCTIYSYYVTAVDINGEETLPSNTIDTLVYYVNPPTNLTYTVDFDGTVNLDWNASPVYCAAIQNYNIYQGNNVYVSNSTNITITGLANCNNYSFYVTAVDTNGYVSEPSNVINIFIKVLYPVTIINITSSHCTSATVYWTNPPVTCVSVSQYNIYANSILIDTAPGSSSFLDISGLNLCQDYSFTVTYIDNGIESYPSNAVIFTVIPCPPTSLTAVIGNTQVTLNWTAPVNSCSPITYNIYYSDGTYIDNTGLLTYDVIGLINGNTYSFYVTSYGANNIDSYPSNTVTTTLTIPDPPTNPGSSILSPSSATVNWSEPGVQNPAITYNVYYSTSNTGPWTIGGTGIPYGTSIITVSGLTSGTSYYFAVASINTYNISSILAITPLSITIPYAIFISASGYNSTLSNFTSNSNQGAIIFTSAGSFDVSYLYGGGSINIVCIGPGGNGLYGGNNAGGAFGGGGGGGGGGGYIGSSNTTSTGSYSASPGSPGTNTTSTNGFITVTGTKGNDGTHGGDASLTSYGSQGIGGIGNGNGGNGDYGGGGSGGDGSSGSPNSYIFTVNSVTYNIYFGGGGGGGKCISSGYYSGGSSCGGNGGAGPNSGGSNRTGSGGVYNIGSAGNIQVGGGGGGGSGMQGSSSTQYDGGPGSNGLVVVYWSI